MGKKGAPQAETAQNSHKADTTKKSHQKEDTIAATEKISADGLVETLNNSIRNVRPKRDHKIVSEPAQMAQVQKLGGLSAMPNLPLKSKSTREQIGQKSSSASERPKRDGRSRISGGFEAKSLAGYSSDAATNFPASGIIAPPSSLGNKSAENERTATTPVIVNPGLSLNESAKKNSCLLVDKTPPEELGKCGSTCKSEKRIATGNLFPWNSIRKAQPEAIDDKAKKSQEKLAAKEAPSRQKMETKKILEATTANPPNTTRRFTRRSLLLDQNPIPKAKPQTASEEGMVRILRIVSEIHSPQNSSTLSLCQKKTLQIWQ